MLHIAERTPYGLENPHPISVYLTLDEFIVAKIEKYWNASIHTNMSLSSNKSKKMKFFKCIFLNTVYNAQIVSKFVSTKALEALSCYQV